MNVKRIQVILVHQSQSQGDHWARKVMEFRKTIFQAWMVMENSKGHGKSLKRRGKVVHNVVKFLQLRNSVMNVGSECVYNFHYYNQLELLLPFFGKNVVPIGHGKFISVGPGKVAENDSRKKSGYPAVCDHKVGCQDYYVLS